MDSQPNKKKLLRYVTALYVLIKNFFRS